MQNPTDSNGRGWHHARHWWMETAMKPPVGFTLLPVQDALTVGMPAVCKIRRMIGISPTPVEYQHAELVVRKMIQCASTSRFLWLVKHRCRTTSIDILRASFPWKPPLMTPATTNGD